MITSKKYFILILFGLFYLIPSSNDLLADTDSGDGYIQIHGLIDLRSTFSDGKHSIEELVKIARSRGFKMLSINDHHRIAIAYGIPPFRNLLRYKEEYPSLFTKGVSNYLQEIERVSKLYPDMIIIPGCEISPYYYWTGSYFKDDLTANDYDKRILVLNFDEPDDYNQIPSIHNKLSLRYTKSLLFPAMIFLGCIIFGFIIIFSKGIYRVIGFVLVFVFILAVINHNPFRSSLYTQYDGDQGITPYQEVIDYVNERGGYSFWNYPEQKSGIRKHGPINVNTPLYPEVIHESQNYTGFAAIYGEYTEATKPGGKWDRALTEYCIGGRKKPPWGISTADFHEDDRLRLGSFPTTFLVKEFSRKAVLEAVEAGRMYSSRGDSEAWPKLDYFNVSGSEGKKIVMGEKMTTEQFPVIRLKVSYESEKPKPMTVILIRGGEVINTITQIPPIELEYIDEGITEGWQTFYRVMDSREHLVSNPIFVTYNPANPI